MARDPNYRKYETVFILRTDLSPEDQEKIFAKIEATFKDFDGHPIRREEWGPRKLAYKVKKQSKGVYYYDLYLGKGGLVAELERNFRLMDGVLKFMTVIVDENIVLDGFDFAAEAGEKTWMLANKGGKAVAATVADDTSVDDDDDDDDDSDEEE